jgi:hypothetical protein
MISEIIFFEATLALPWWHLILIMKLFFNKEIHLKKT